MTEASPAAGPASGPEQDAAPHAVAQAADLASTEPPVPPSLDDPPADLADRVRLLETVETDLRERLGRLERR